ncbi:MAG: bifunctional phosphopantothenoylcysteine decarboxylase/phosphopantothenate--cysteine ligase CoaBC [Pseudomonadota bacterium]
MCLENKTILLGVCGGIAAYKAVELVRLMRKAGARVRVVMTRSALEFVGETTFRVLSENDVCTGLFNTNESSVRHIEWATEADAVVIAPATANMVAKLANGIADDALSTIMLAVRAPVLVCPSMNTNMYDSRAVQRNLDVLESDGMVILEPGSGELACKTTGTGRLPEPWHILDRLKRLLTPKDLSGKTVLVTAGPTREALDPVRYISNHSSGKMGYAVAEAAEKRGGRVLLVSGPVNLPAPLGTELIPVDSARQMADAVLGNMDRADIIVKVAAVADYRPLDTSDHKIKKDQGRGLTLELTENPDILKAVGQRKKNQFLVGFAAETRDLETYALGKMKKKNLDIIVGNIVGVPGSGFGADQNKVKLFFRDGTSEDVPSMDKLAVAHHLLNRIMERLGKQ